MLKGIAPVGTAGIPLNELWDVVFKQPLSGTEHGLDVPWA